MTPQVDELPRPTRGELKILKVLWRHGPSTVREIHDALSTLHPTGYTTALKMLQVMTAKGLVRRDARERAHIYSAAVPQRLMLRRIVSDLIDRAFGGSTARLVLHALDSRKLTEEERREIRDILDEYEKRGRPKPRSGKG